MNSNLFLHLALLVLILLSACDSGENNSIEETNGRDTGIISKSNTTSSHHTQLDTVHIVSGMGDTLSLSKATYNTIIDKHPEFFNEYPDHPDFAFQCANQDEFNSEVGQDIYYVLYAHFLKQNNGEATFSAERRKLINIYQNINSLFAMIEYGGTAFGHRYERIPAYAEYAIYIRSQHDEQAMKPYDISTQKALYLQSLRQLIEDESKIDFNVSGQEKSDRIKAQHAMVDQLDMLLTDNFYLKRAQEFQYRYYQFY